MKLVTMADWHLRSTPPTIRKDKDFHLAQTKKVQQIVDIANDNDAILVIPGDLFDSVRVGYQLVYSVMEKFRDVERGVIITGGNHCVYFHNPDIVTSPLGMLNYLDNVTVLDGQMEVDGVVFTGAFFEQEPMKPVEGKINILVYHVSVYEKEVPFFMEGRAFTAKSLKRKYQGFDYYCTGDIHIPFTDGSIVNSGSLIRDNVNHVDYEPRVYLIDTDEDTVMPVFIDIDKDVFNSISKDTDLDDSEYAIELDKLIASMKTTQDIPKYDDVCLELAKDDDEVTTIFKETFDELRQSA